MGGEEGGRGGGGEERGGGGSARRVTIRMQAFSSRVGAKKKWLAFVVLNALPGVSARPKTIKRRARVFSPPALGQSLEA